VSLPVFCGASAQCLSCHVCVSIAKFNHRTIATNNARYLRWKTCDLTTDPHLTNMLAASAAIKAPAVCQGLMRIIYSYTPSAAAAGAQQQQWRRGNASAAGARCSRSMGRVVVFDRTWAASQHHTTHTQTHPTNHDTKCRRVASQRGRQRRRVPAGDKGARRQRRGGGGGLHRQVVWAVQGDRAPVRADEQAVSSGRFWWVGWAGWAGLGWVLFGRAAVARLLWATQQRDPPQPNRLQATFLKVDIDNEQLQRTVMDHGITGVVSAGCCVPGGCASQRVPPFCVLTGLYSNTHHTTDRPRPKQLQ